MTGKVLRGLGYKVVEAIGRGAFSEVKLAESLKHNEKVAIKIIEHKYIPPDFVSKSLPKELSILKTVKHQHIVGVHDIHKLDGQVLIVMEAAIMNLQEKISTLRHIPPDQAKIWFSQLVSAVEYLHELDIVHRDLKSTNVLLTAEEKIKLADFGLAGFYKGLSETYFCTFENAAPEVRKQIPYDPKKSDVWSLGVILYHMVTGTLPFVQDNFTHFAKGEKVPLCFPAHISVEKSCQDFITEMLNYDPSARPSITDVAKHPWLQLGQTNDEDNQQQQPSNKKDGNGVLSSLKTGFRWITTQLWGDESQ